MCAYKVAWYGWFALTPAAVAFQRPLSAILPTVYMPIVGIILYKKYRDMTYADIYSVAGLYRRFLFSNFRLLGAVEYGHARRRLDSGGADSHHGEPACALHRQEICDHCLYC